MSRIFLSHSSQDNFEAVALRAWLASEGWDDVFLDLDPERGIAAGERWERALHAAALRCEAVIFLVSRNWLASGWCRKEHTLAAGLDKTLFAVLIDPNLTLADIPPELKGSWQVVPLTGGELSVFRTSLPGSLEERHIPFSRDGLHRLKRGLEKAGLDPKFFAWPPKGEPGRAPYRGLKPLEAEDAGIFFGRDAPIIEAIDRLRRLHGGAPPRLFVLLGASGAGKSSFLRAGILPRLTREDGQFIPLSPLRPEHAALYGEHGLLSALEAAFPKRTRAELRAAVQVGATGVRPLLAELVAAARNRHVSDDRPAKPPAVVIAIDQAEELFRGDGAKEGAELVEMLSALGLSDDPAVIAIFAIRSDSYDALEHAAPFRGLAQATQPLLPMPHGAYKDVIEGPARRVEEAGGRLDIEPRLTQELLLDIDKGAGIDALPLLALTLEQLYLEYRQAGVLSYANYEALGELKGAIDAAVARAFKRADADPAIPRDAASREALLRKGLIPWLAGVDPYTKSVRRNIAVYTDIPLDSRRLLDLLVEERLLSTDTDTITDATDQKKRIKTIEPAHEALLRNWRLLEGWLTEDLALLAALEGVKHAAREWEDKPEGEAEAWLAHQGQRLAEARALYERPDIAARLDNRDRRYLAACQARADAVQREREERAAKEAEEQERRIRDAEAIAAAEHRVALWTRRGLGASLILLAAAVVAAVIAFIQWRVAQDQTARAIATREDSAEVARLARSELSNTNDALSRRIDDLMRWTPPVLGATLHHWRANARENARDFAAERADLDAELRAEPDFVPSLIASSDNFNMVGDFQHAIRDAKAALAAGSRDAVVYANLALAEAIGRDYQAAMGDIDNALHGQRTIDVTESLVASDLQGFTSGFKLWIRDSDFLVALGYVKAALSAMSGGADFAATLTAADAADRDQPLSRSAYLVALNWEWLILRGQALADERASKGATPGATTVRDYGAFVAEAELWRRIAATRGDFAGYSQRSFAKFDEAYKVAPRDAYRALADFAAKEEREEVKKPYEPATPLGDARDLEVRAIEWANGPSSASDPYAAAPALARLTEAIGLLDPVRLGRQPGRREQDALIDLLLRRGAWRLAAGDRGGADEDARRVISIDGGIAAAHALRGDALLQAEDRRKEYQQALTLDPGNVEALEGMAWKIDGTPAETALGFAERLRHFKRFEADDLARMAALLTPKHSDEARQSIDAAIEMAPDDKDYYLSRRKLVATSDQPGKSDNFAVSRDLHDRARFLAQSGDNAAALGSYVQALHALPKGADQAEIEVASLVRDFSAFLIARYGQTDAAAWWGAFAQNPLATDDEKKIAAAEAQRLTAQP